jgi:hypothetical protein
MGDTRFAKPRLRTLLMAAGVAAVGISGLGFSQAGAKAATQAPKHHTPACAVTSTPSMVEMGLGTTASSIADVIQVSCAPVYGEDQVEINGQQLYDACQGTLSWYQPGFSNTANGGAGLSTGPQFAVTLDDDGNANAVVFGGPSCAASRDTIFASLEDPPYVTASTTFTVRPPQNTPHGVFATPMSLVEDSVYSAFATVISVEYPAVDSEYGVTIKSDELNFRCNGGITWIGPDEISYTTGDETTVPLDNNGNAFVVAIGDDSCSAGVSTISSDLTIAPYTTYSTQFRILSPRVRRR